MALSSSGLHRTNGRRLLVVLRSLNKAELQTSTSSGKPAGQLSEEQ